MTTNAGNSITGKRELVLYTEHPFHCLVNCNGEVKCALNSPLKIFKKHIATMTTLRAEKESKYT